MQKTQQKALLLGSLSGYYAKNAANRTVLREIVSGNSKLSLRVIDWFLTHYANLKDVVYWLDDKGRLVESPQGQAGLTRYCLYEEYRTQLKSFTKLHFDPFRRHERITFIVETQPEVASIETTVGQLNFFRWAIHYRVVQYIINHLAEIEKAMQSSEFVSRSKNKDNKDNTEKNVPKNKSKKSVQHVQPVASVSGPVHYAQCKLRFD